MKKIDLTISNDSDKDSADTSDDSDSDNIGDDSSADVAKDEDLSNLPVFRGDWIDYGETPEEIGENEATHVGSSLWHLPSELKSKRLKEKAFQDYKKSRSEAQNNIKKKLPLPPPPPPEASPIVLTKKRKISTRQEEDKSKKHSKEDSNLSNSSIITPLLVTKPKQLKQAISPFQFLPPATPTPPPLGFQSRELPQTNLVAPTPTHTPTSTPSAVVGDKWRLYAQVQKVRHFISISSAENILNLKNEIQKRISHHRYLYHQPVQILSIQRVDGVLLHDEDIIGECFNNGDVVVVNIGE